MRVSSSILLFIISFTLIYSGALFSFGDFTQVIPIRLFSGFFISDFGLLLPIAFFILNNKMRMRMDKTSKIILICYFATFLYGLVIHLMNLSNNNKFLGGDLRIFVSFFSGFAMVSNLKLPKEKIIRFFNILTTFISIVILFLFINLPNFSNWRFDRVGSEGIYVLIGFPLLMIPVLILISIESGKKLDKILPFINFTFLLTVTILFLKTRSLFLDLIFGMFILFWTKNKISQKKVTSSIQIKPHRLRLFIILFIAIFFLAENVSPIFFHRFSEMENYSEDINIETRLMEPVIVFSNINTINFIFGSGLSPKSNLINEKGQNYSIMHIGILNLLWRFGLIIFLIWLFVFIKLIIRWLKTKGGDSKNKIFIFFVPSLLLYFFLATMSGGYSVGIFLSLGMLLGFYRNYIQGFQFITTGK